MLRYVANEGLAFLWVDPESHVVSCLFYGGEAIGLAWLGGSQLAAVVTLYTIMSSAYILSTYLTFR